MIEYITLGLLVVSIILNIVLILILGKIANVVMGFIGNDEGAPGLGGGLPNVDLERVLASLVMQGGTQLITEAKQEKGGLLGMLKNTFKPKDKETIGQKLDEIALEPGALAIDKKGPAPNPIKDALEGALGGSGAP